MKEQLAEEKNIPQYLRSHWQKETGFAFPSGHTMFAASWALLAVGLLWPRRRTLTIAIFAGLGQRESWEAACCSGCIGHAIWCSYVDFVGTGGGGNVACATNLRAINTTCGRKSRNSATRTRKLTLVDFPNLALKSSTMRVDAISQTARKWYFKGLLR